MSFLSVLVATVVRAKEMKRGYYSKDNRAINSQEFSILFVKMFFVTCHLRPDAEHLYALTKFNCTNIVMAKDRCFVPNLLAKKQPASKGNEHEVRRNKTCSCDGMHLHTPQEDTTKSGSFPK